MPSPTLVIPSSRDRDFLSHLSRLSPKRCLANYRAGLLTVISSRSGRFAIPTRPLVNGELPWIALRITGRLPACSSYLVSKAIKDGYPKGAAAAQVLLTGARQPDPSTHRPAFDLNLTHREIARVSVLPALLVLERAFNRSRNESLAPLP
jgi:hypothetical protein